MSLTSWLNRRKDKEALVEEKDEPDFVDTTELDKKLAEAQIMTFTTEQRDRFVGDMVASIISSPFYLTSELLFLDVDFKLTTVRQVNGGIAINLDTPIFEEGEYWTEFSNLLGSLNLEESILRALELEGYRPVMASPLFSLRGIEFHPGPLERNIKRYSFSRLVNTTSQDIKELTAAEVFAAMWEELDSGKRMLSTEVILPLLTSVVRSSLQVCRGIIDDFNHNGTNLLNAESGRVSIYPLDIKHDWFRFNSGSYGPGLIQVSFEFYGLYETWIKRVVGRDNREDFIASSFESLVGHFKSEALGFRVDYDGDQYTLSIYLV